MEAHHNADKRFRTGDKVDFRICAHPSQVLKNPTMTAAEKRSLLSSWVSAARPLQDYPVLLRLDGGDLITPHYPGVRQLEDGRLVILDELFRALKRLDEGEDRPHSERPSARSEKRARLGSLWLRHKSSDDDDPFGPASAVLPIPHGVGTQSAV
jgi:hypothetical protein